MAATSSAFIDPQHKLAPKDKSLLLGGFSLIRKFPRTDTISLTIIQKTYIFSIIKGKRPYKKRYDPTPMFRKNREIFARELRVIDEQGQNLGVLDKDTALKMAEERGLDLIEAVPTATPPVGRIGSYDKFRYQKEKEKKKEEQAKAQAKDDIKHVRIGLKSARNDLLIRAKQIDEFIKEGYKVEILLKLRGREKANKEWAREKLEEFLELITEDIRIMSSPKAGGTGFTVQISKN